MPGTRRAGLKRLGGKLSFLWRAGRREPRVLVVRSGTGRRRVLLGAARALTAFLALAAAARPASAAFLDAGMDPRAAALGGASLGAADSSVFTNPAAPAALAANELYMSYDRMYAGLEGVGSFDRGAISAAFPLRYGVLSTGLWRFAGGGLTEELVVGLGWSKQLARGARLGLLGKYLHHAFKPGGADAADPVFAAGTGRGAFAADAGLSLPVAAGLRLGLSVQNLNEPDVGLRSEDRVPREFRAGLSWDAPAYGVTVFGDLGLSGSALPRVGVEKAVYGRTLAFRAGAGPSEFTAGFGLSLGRLGFDYALVLRRELMEGNMGTHSLGVRLGFGGAR